MKDVSPQLLQAASFFLVGAVTVIAYFFLAEGNKADAILAGVLGAALLITSLLATSRSR